MTNADGNDWKRNIARNLLSERKRRSWTQVEMGIRMGLPEMTVSHYETGRRTPGLANLIKLSERLCLPLDHIVFGSRYVQQESEK